MGNCCRKSSYEAHSSKKRSKSAAYQMPSAILDLHHFNQFVGPSLSSQGVSPSSGSDAIHVEAEEEPMCEKEVIPEESPESSFSEPEQLTSALRLPVRRPICIPLLNLSQLPQPCLDPPKICIQEPWSVPLPSKPRDDHPSLSLSSSSGAVPAGSSSIQSKLDASAFGFSSETKSVAVDTSPGEPQGVKAQKALFEEEKSQTAVLTVEDGVNCTEEQANVKIAISGLSHHSEASTQTFRPVITAHVKFVSRLEITRSGSATHLNEYTILHELRSEGRRGAWYRAANSDKRLVIWEYWKSSQGKYASLARQIGILDKLIHPGVLQLMEVIDCPCEDVGYFVFEDAERFATGGEMTEVQVREVFKSLISTVLYLHEEAQVVHLSIRVESLLLTEDFQVKLCDFALAQSVKDSEETYRQQSQPIDALSPESLRSKLFQGKPADIWACGVTLYRLLYGKSPFSGQSRTQTYDRFQCEE